METNYKIGDIVICSKYCTEYNGKELTITKIYENGDGRTYYNFNTSDGKSANSSNFSDQCGIKLVSSQNYYNIFN